jgi:hypothetical protein
MSYRNPQIIVDRSAEIWADNISKIGQGVANTIQAYGQAKANALAEVKKKDDAYRNHLAKGQELQRRDIESASKNFKGTASQLEDWKKEVRELGEPILALQTSNALDTGLTKEQRDANNKKINEYYDYLEASTVSIGGVIDKIKLVAEGGVNPENYGINVISTGTNTMEKFETMVAGFALADVPQDGIKVEKTNSGEPMNKNFGVKYTINSKKYNEFVESGMLNEGSLGEPDGEGNYHGKWERNLKKFGNSNFQFFSQVTNEDNANAALEESGFIDKNTGNSTGKFLATDIRTEIIDGKEYTYQHINPDIVFEDPTYKAVKIAEAKAILSYGGKDSYNTASTTFNWGKDQSFEKWNNATREQKIDELYKDMFEQDMSRIMKLPNGQLPETRVATEDDVAYYKKMGWDDIIAGNDHVWFVTKKIKEIDKGGGGAGSPNPPTDPLKVKYGGKTLEQRINIKNGIAAIAEKEKDGDGNETFDFSFQRPTDASTQKFQVRYIGKPGLVNVAKYGSGGWGDEIETSVLAWQNALDGPKTAKESLNAIEKLSLSNQAKIDENARLEALNPN